MGSKGASGNVGASMTAAWQSPLIGQRMEGRVDVRLCGVMAINLPAVSGLSVQMLPYLT